MKLLTSKKMHLPVIYLVENNKDIASLPLGIPFIKGKIKEYNDYVKLIEFEVLLRSALKSGLPFKWEQILRENGYKNLYKFTAYSEKCCYCTSTEKVELDDHDFTETEGTTISELIEDISYQVDSDVLKELKVIPSWFSEKVEDGIKSNILDSIKWNPGFYNKKLGDVSGAITIGQSNKNLIVIDISGSIPTSVGKACLLLSKTMSHLFYADLIITGAKSKLFDYTEIEALDVNDIYRRFGDNNEAADFRRIVSESRNYDNAIVFGDNHSPLQVWNTNRAISFTQAYDICNFKIGKIFSFHTTNFERRAGYADMFDCPNIEYVENWVRDLN